MVNKVDDMYNKLVTDCKIDSYPFKLCNIFCKSYGRENDVTDSPDCTFYAIMTC